MRGPVSGRGRKPTPTIAWPPCPSGKATYLTRADAAQVAKWNRGQIGPDAARLRAYRCTVCENFHIGNQPEARVRGYVTRSDMHHNKRMGGASA